MKFLWMLFAMATLAIPAHGQQKAEEGTYQVTIPNYKFSENLTINEQSLKEIESLRGDTEDRNILLTNGLRVKVISRESVDAGKRVFKWKLEQ